MAYAIGTAIISNLEVACLATENTVRPVRRSHGPGNQDARQVKIRAGSPRDRARARSRRRNNCSSSSDRGRARVGRGYTSLAGEALCRVRGHFPSGRRLGGGDRVVATPQAAAERYREVARAGRRVCGWLAGHWGYPRGYYPQPPRVDGFRGRWHSVGYNVMICDRRETRNDYGLLGRSVDCRGKVTWRRSFRRPRFTEEL